MSKEIKVVQGDGDEIDFSPVYDHLNISKPKIKKDKKEIIIPEEKKKN